MANIIPLPSASAKRVHRTRRVRTPWYKKPKRIIPIALLGLIIVTAVLGWLYLNRSFDQINTLSALPDIVNVEILDGAGDVAIDTGPAERAIVQAESTDRNNEEPSNGLAAAHGMPTPLIAPGSTPASVARWTAPSEGSVFVLLMGVDARSGEAIDVGVRPDSLSVLHLDQELGTCRILGIPRDTRTELPGYGLTKINHALAVGGVPYQQIVVENLLGIPIDHYALVDFAGVVGVVDAVGGIVVDNPDAFDHLDHHFDAGTIRLDGTMALTYSRYRYDAGGDFARIDRQQQVIRAILAKLSPSNAVRLLPQLMRDLGGHFKTDLSVGGLVGLVNDYGNTCTAETLETQALTGSVATFPDPLFNANLSYVELDSADIDAGVNWLLTGEQAVAARWRED